LCSENFPHPLAPRVVLTVDVVVGVVEVVVVVGVVDVVLVL
jgi:hypothetical protein